MGGCPRPPSTKTQRATCPQAYESLALQPGIHWASEWCRPKWPCWMPRYSPALWRWDKQNQVRWGTWIQTRQRWDVCRQVGWSLVRQVEKHSHRFKDWNLRCFCRNELWDFNCLKRSANTWTYWKKTTLVWPSEMLTTTRYLSVCLHACLSARMSVWTLIFSFVELVGSREGDEEADQRCITDHAHVDCFTCLF